MVHITIDSSMNQIEKLPNKKTVSLHCRFVPQRHHFQKLPLQWVPFFRQFLEFSEGLGQLLRDCEAHHLCYWQGLVSLGGGRSPYIDSHVFVCHWEVGRRRHGFFLILRRSWDEVLRKTLTMKKRVKLINEPIKNRCWKKNPTTSKAGFC